MLRSFRFANHKSFRDEQELLLMPAYDKERPVVPVAALYGANASGKSNVVNALQFMVRAVRDSYSRWEPGAGIPRHPFKLSAAGRTAPSRYVIEASIEGARYVYGFVIDDHEIREEWLYSYPRGRRRVLFERAGRDVDFGSTVTGPKSTIEHLVRPDSLFLSLAVRLDIEVVRPVYGWFLREFVFRRPDRSGLAAMIATQPARARRIRDLVRLADLGIEGVHTLEASAAGSLPPPWRLQSTAHYLEMSEGNRRWSAHSMNAGDQAERRELVFVHGADGDAPPLTLAEQSHGTVEWLRLVWNALAVLDDGRMMVVDEIDSSLHPLLVAELVRMFQSSATNPRGAQLLFTAHDTSLMGTALGEEVLRRDEIWFVEKGQGGASTIYPLTDFHPRKGENPERRYLGGSYGAVPVLPESERGQVAPHDEA